jgi:Flp pilus assembly protein TadG
LSADNPVPGWRCQGARASSLILCKLAAISTMRQGFATYARAMKTDRKLLALARRWARDRSGAAAVEFGLIMPMLAGILLPIADLGMGAYAKMRVQDAAAAGAQYALEHGYTESAITTAVQEATSLGSNVTLSSTPAEACYCVSSNVLVPPPGDETAPSPPCTSGACSDGSTPGTFVTVNTSDTYTTLIPYSIPGLNIPSSIALAGTATVRID